MKKDLYWITSRQGEAWISINTCIWINWTLCVAIIKNAKSNKMGKKDIMKIEECPIDFMDLDILGFIDHNITVNIIKKILRS